MAKIGPLAISAGEKHSAQYMEAVLTPGMTAPAHLHGGPEAWYTLAGETCLETSDGHFQVGRAGGPALIVPIGLSMHLTATGTEKRKSSPKSRCVLWPPGSRYGRRHGQHLSRSRSSNFGASCLSTIWPEFEAV